MSERLYFSDDEKDNHLKERRGCAGEPTVINFDNHTVEMCLQKKPRFMRGFLLEKIQIIFYAAIY